MKGFVLESGHSSVISSELTLVEQEDHGDH
jgi:hypothetical protein